MNAVDELKDYWVEYIIHQETKLPNDYLEEEYPSKQYEEGEQEAEWLRTVDMGHLADAFRNGREVTDAELHESLGLLSNIQAEAVERRVRVLNRTVRDRHRQQRHPRPHVRDIFQDVETSSTGTRSRSATPDSLDSISNLPESDRDEPTDQWEYSVSPTATDSWSLLNNQHPTTLIGSVPSYLQVLNTDGEQNGASVNRNVSQKEIVRWTSSAPVSPVSCEGLPSESTVLPLHEMFRKSRHWSSNMHRVDIASDTEGIELLGFNRLDTLQYTRGAKERVRSGSDPTSVTSTISLSHLNLTGSNGDLHMFIEGEKSMGHKSASQTNVKSEAALFTEISGPEQNKGISTESISFENCFQQNSIKKEQEISVIDDLTKVSVDNLSDQDLKDLKPILWLEISALFEKYSVTVREKRGQRKKHKEDGNVFGVNLKTLIMRDCQLINDTCTTPLIFNYLFNRLLTKGVKEEGILRVAGHKQKVEMLSTEIEQHFYSKSEHVQKLIDTAPPHDLTSILKKLLRELPQPLLSVELIDMFYQTHVIESQTEQIRVLNLLVLLLPLENRSTLRALISFLTEIVNNEKFNKMNLHNVATIMAPSLFPPRFVHPKNKNDLSAQVNMAAVCCRLVERLLQCGTSLCTVPAELLAQAAQRRMHSRTKAAKKPIRQKKIRKPASSKNVT